MAWTARPAPARPSLYRRPRQPCPAEDAKHPARQRQHHAQHAEGQGQRAKADGETPGHHPPRLPTSTPPHRPSATSRQQPPARLHPVPPGIRHGIQSARHDQHDQQERGEGKGRRATDEEPRPRVKNFFTRLYIGRTPPRYTPKDTPAACILHRFQRPFSARLASRADRLQFCFWRVCRTRRPKRPTTDATNARPPAPCPPVDGGAFTFSARRHF